ncbi:hypothetical protein SLEP1_g31743 [Rubroshorea leprosula]|uniref:Uncharacterized protein n=1 Tax=Rubroshorea leprosula TaxID=152421 RepID=A0AAV5KAA0_9ROSI|nr:hypothetical protein SLEP1_g31743 [Rubroshorea leprosula]
MWMDCHGHQGLLCPLQLVACHHPRTMNAKDGLSPLEMRELWCFSLSPPSPSPFTKKSKMVSELQ